MNNDIGNMICPKCGGNLNHQDLGGQSIDATLVCSDCGWREDK